MQINEDYLQIDISNFKYETDEDDLIEIKLRNEDILRVNYSKLVSQSKYIRDKYKYSEALYSMQHEIKNIEEQMNINDECITQFIQLIQQEKVNIPIKHYKDFYTLSKYFDIPKFIRILDDISKKDLFENINFSIQILLDSKSSNSDFESDLTSKIEIFLSTRINECFKNRKFSELPISCVYRIIALSDKDSFNQNLLFDFIVESASVRFILFKFIELHKLEDDKIEEFFHFIDKQQEESKKIYLENVPFSFSFVRQMKKNSDKLFRESNQTKEELNQTKEEFGKTKEKLNQTKEEFGKIKEELNQTKEELNQTKEELNQTKEELNQTKEELNQTKEEFGKTKEEFGKTKEELNQTKGEFRKTKIKLEPMKDEMIKDGSNRLISEVKQYTGSIVAGGINSYNQIGVSFNNQNKSGILIISPPKETLLDPNSLLSYSIYNLYSVIVTINGSLQGIGYNNDGRINCNLKKAHISKFTEFSIGKNFIPFSAVCTAGGTLYILSNSYNNNKCLVLTKKNSNSGNPIFINIGNQYPVALFGGNIHLAAISNNGDVIFINYYSIFKSSTLNVSTVSLPGHEKASSVACCHESVFVLSSNGQVFSSSIENESNNLKFTAVSELEGIEIVCVSGTWEHVFAVSKDGHVFGCGSNGNGRLGLEKNVKSVPTFTEIIPLEGYEIRAAYAGYNHSLFVTNEGKVLSCGSNEYGQLLLISGPSEDIYSPTETAITSEATFCIAGGYISVVFINQEPPPNTPNMRIRQHK